MRFAVIVLVFCSFVFGENLSDRLQNLIQNKREKRVQILSYDPFLAKQEIKRRYKKDLGLKKENKRIRKRDLRLVSIMGKKAFINGKWLGIGSIVDGYRVKDIGNESVTLIRKRKKRILRFEKIAEIVKVREK